MSRAIALVALTIALALGGCLRNKYDLCGEVSPHPECDAGPAPHDAGSPDAGLDGAAEDAAMTEDSGARADDDPDAGGQAGAGDAGAGEDAGGEPAD